MGSSLYSYQPTLRGEGHREKTVARRASDGVSVD
jgi:hypothetical protein